MPRETASTNPLAWDIVSDNPESKAQIKKAEEAANEVNSLFLTAFSTPSGKKVLEWLITHTLDCPTWWPGDSYDKSIANGFFREGQNSLIRQIKAKIKQARDYQEKRK